MAKPHLGAVPRQPGRSRRRRGVLAALLGSVLACCAAVNADEWIYVVRPGDTLWTLTERHLKHLGYVTRLQAANGVDNPYALPPGMRLRIPLDWSRRRPGVARVVGHGGTCTLARDGGAAPVGIAMGAELSVGDEVTCAANSYVTLEFEDGSQLRVQPDSQIHLDAAWVYGDAGYFVHDVALQRGRTESSVPQQQPAATRLRIVTPASTTSVRGTRFRVAADESDAASRSEVEHGRVSVDAQRRSVSVDAGFGSVTRAGAAPSPPVPLLPAPDLSDVPAVLERVPLRFSLAGLPGATGYRGGVAADAKFTRLIAEFSSDSTPCVARTSRMATTGCACAGATPRAWRAGTRCGALRSTRARSHRSCCSRRLAAVPGSPPNSPGQRTRKRTTTRSRWPARAASKRR